MLVPRRLLGAAIALVLTSGWLLALPERAYAESAISPKSGNFTVRGSGFGHGWGMSQYGAYGAARNGLSWEQILRFYYPGTKLTKMASGTTLRVWVTGDTDGTLRVRPASGLTVSDSSGERFKVPTGSKYRSWRISRSGSGYKLTYRNSSGSNVSVSTGLSSGTWSFSSSSKIIEVIMPSGSVRPYRGSVALVKRGSSGRTVNRVLLEDYVKGVVASEMPTSWHPEAVRAQTVAARSYAVRIRDFYSYDGYDICDTTACQVYGGINRETSAGNAAVKATNGTIVTYKGAAALTQFASSNGGHSAQGDHPYLAPRPDPYDGVIKSQAWTRTVSASSIASRWSVGTVRKLQITDRDGAGAWGGRVESIKIIGSNEDDHDHRLQLLPRLRPAVPAVHLRRVVRDPDAGPPLPGRPDDQAGREVRDLPAQLPLRLQGRPHADQLGRPAAALSGRQRQARHLGESSAAGSAATPTWSTPATGTVTATRT